MFTFLLIVQTLVAAALVGVILMQRSEGGGLGVGGSSSGFMTARGAADFLTRSTAVLATIFIILAIALAAIAGVSRAPATLDTSLVNQSTPTAPVTSPVVPVPQQQQAPTNQPAPAVPVQQ
jgi:preprotein translocase subunit SecG